MFDCNPARHALLKSEQRSELKQFPPSSDQLLRTIISSFIFSWLTLLIFEFSTKDV